jgi:type I restriction enzyme M protein
VDIQTIIDRNYDLDIKNPNKQEETHEYSSSELMLMLEKSFGKSQDLLNQLKEAVK